MRPSNGAQAARLLPAPDRSIKPRRDPVCLHRRDLRPLPHPPRRGPRLVTEAGRRRALNHITRSARRALPAPGRPRKGLKRPKEPGPRQPVLHRGLLRPRQHRELKPAAHLRRAEGSRTLRVVGRKGRHPGDRRTSSHRGPPPKGSIRKDRVKGRPGLPARRRAAEIARRPPVRVPAMPGRAEDAGAARRNSSVRTAVFAGGRSRRGNESLPHNRPWASWWSAQPFPSRISRPPWNWPLRRLSVS